VLTPAATELLPATTRLFDEAAAVFRMFEELAGAGATLLRVAAGDYLATPLLVPVLRRLAVAGVPLHFEISTVHSEEALLRLERGDVDLAIASHVSERPTLIPRTLLDQTFYWIAARRETDDSSGQLVLARRLASEPLLRLAPGSLGRKLLDRLIEAEGVRPKSTIDVASVSLLLAYVQGGVGVGLVPALSLDGIDRAGVVLARAAVDAVPVQVVTRVGWHGGAVVERFIAELVTRAEALRPTAATAPRRRRRH
jgi:DNA-binding transcriptional LysR family regulator